MIQWIGAICVVGACGACGFSMAASYTGQRLVLAAVAQRPGADAVPDGVSNDGAPELCGILASACMGPVGKVLCQPGPGVAAGRGVGGAGLRGLGPGPGPGTAGGLPWDSLPTGQNPGPAGSVRPVAGSGCGAGDLPEGAGAGGSFEGGPAPLLPGLGNLRRGCPGHPPSVKPMEVDLIFKIAAVGIIVTILNQVLVRSGREEQATMTTLAGLVVVLMILAQRIAALFDLVKTLFQF